MSAVIDRGARIVAACALLSWGALACGGGETKVGRARLPEADGVEPAPAGPVVEIPPPPPPPKEVAGSPGAAITSRPPEIDLPAGTRIARIAADRDVPYVVVFLTAENVVAAGARPVYLVSRRDELAILPEPAEHKEESIRLVAYADGRACVSPPGVEEATCVIRDGGKHVDRAFVRELVRKARKEYGLSSTRVVVHPLLSWADAVRAIDGARTCCGNDQMEVSVEMLPTTRALPVR